MAGLHTSSANGKALGTKGVFEAPRVVEKESRSQEGSEDSSRKARYSSKQAREAWKAGETCYDRKEVPSPEILKQLEAEGLLSFPKLNSRQAVFDRTAILVKTEEDIRSAMNELSRIDPYGARMRKAYRRAINIVRSYKRGE